MTLLTFPPLFQYLILGPILFLTVLWLITRPPANRPQQIPFLPMATSFRKAWKRTSRPQYYDRDLRTLLEKHGAINMWIAGQWSILVTQPNLVVQVLKNEAVIAKRGFLGKIPWGMAAHLFGRNLITSHGEQYKRFASIIMPGYQREFELEAVKAQSRDLTSAILQEQHSTPDQLIIVDKFVQRWAISNACHFLFDVHLGRIDDDDSLASVLGAAQLLTQRMSPKGILEEFPILEKLRAVSPHIRKSFQSVDTLTAHLLQIVEPLETSVARTENQSKVIYRLKDALSRGDMTDQNFRDNLRHLYIASTEEVNSTLLCAIWELANDETLQDQLRIEINKCLPQECYTTTYLDALPVLNSILYETFRLYPPLSQMVNRQTKAPIQIGNFVIPPGVWVGWNSYGTNTHTPTWGDNAKKFVPARWGTNINEIKQRWRMAQARCECISFNAYSRRCAGQGFAIHEMQVALVEMTRRMRWKADPEHTASLGPGPILGIRGAKIQFIGLQDPCLRDTT